MNGGGGGVKDIGEWVFVGVGVWRVGIVVD